MYQQALVDKTHRKDLLVNLLDITCVESPRYTYLLKRHSALTMIQNKYYVILPLSTLEIWYDLFYEYSQTIGDERVMDRDTYWKCMRLLNNPFSYMTTPLHKVLFERMCTIYENHMTLTEFLLSLLMANDMNPYCSSLFREFIEDTLWYIDKHPLEGWEEAESPLIILGIRITYEFMERVYQYRKYDTKMYQDVYTLLIRMNTIQ